MRIIITGATGMVGEGVLLECLQNSQVTHVLSISRRSLNHSHPKLKEILLTDFKKINSIADQVKDYNACFFCAGVSSVGEDEDSFTRKTYDFVIPFATDLCKINPDVTFIYISGKGTDSTEKGKTMWAKVKGKVENDLQKLPFKSVYSIRPGFMKPMPGQRNVPRLYKIIGILYPFIKTLLPDYATTLQEVALAMIHCVSRGYKTHVLEVADIKKTSRGQSKGGATSAVYSRLSVGMGWDAFYLCETLLTQPILVVVGDKPGGFGAYRDDFEVVRRAASAKKELLVVEGYSHYDLYDQPEPVKQALAKAIPFFKVNL
jgi:hypothetical protein